MTPLQTSPNRNDDGADNDSPKGTSMTNPNRRISLVTGANKGIGLEIARQLGKAGHRVLLGARDDSRGREAAHSLQSEGIDVRYVVIDLSDVTSLASTAADIEENEGRVDVLVNNAGITVQTDGLPGVADLDAVRQAFETNFFGTVAVTQALLPLVKKSTSGCIVNVSSGLGSITLNSDPNWAFAAVKFLGYNSSKAALNMFTVLLAAELRESGIKVNAVNPGYTATDLNGHSGHQTIPQGAAEAVRLALLADDGPTGVFSSSEGVVPW
jgi:NAD(P)-dependent dehydrogenase (short-subunit alcohol dehydrogenase family)